ncbi:MAG: Gfo/Idh/MocA family oxidoreductase [Clostridia bacterium]|nr:Gfo/Idh/MocA family oxidoreductase [Clostridia bacterium]
MKKVAILGCENSHASNFLQYIKDRPKFSDVEVVGIYSNEAEAVEKLHNKYGVPVMENPEDAVGRIDGLIITARHGDNHYKYAKPYIASGIPMFIDKPITISEDEAVQFMSELRENGIRITGGSSVKHADLIYDLKAKAQAEEGGRTIGGVIRAPLSSDSPYGGFFFYSQHLVEMSCEVFGRYPKSVMACQSGEKSVRSVLLRYPDFDVHGTFCDHNYIYHMLRYTTDQVQGGTLEFGEAFCREFDEFHKLLHGGEQKISYEDFISPVFIMNALARALESGKEEPVKEYTL